MPVKMQQKAPATETPKTGLDAATVKQINKLAIPLAKKAATMRQASEELEQSTFQLYADFRTTVRENFEDNKQAARQLGIVVLASVYDIPTTAIRLDGRDTAVLVYPEKYTNKKGKEVDHPKAGQEIPDSASDDDKEIGVHPQVKGAAKLYQMVSRLLKVAIPEDDRAKALVDEALDDDGTCQCTEPQLYQLATGASREIVPKGSHGGQRQAKNWDTKTVTAEIEKILRKGWNGEEIIPGYKGENSLEELSECVTAALANLMAEAEKVTKAQKKAAKANGASKAEPETEDED